MVILVVLVRCVVVAIISWVRGDDDIPPYAKIALYPFVALGIVTIMLLLFGDFISSINGIWGTEILSQWELDPRGGARGENDYIEFRPNSIDAVVQAYDKDLIANATTRNQD